MYKFSNLFLVASLMGLGACSKQEQPQSAAPLPTAPAAPVIDLKMTDLYVQCAVYTFVLKNGLELNAESGLKAEQLSDFQRQQARISSAYSYYADKVRQKYGETALGKPFNDLAASVMEENKSDPSRIIPSAITCIQWHEKREL